MTIHLPPIDRDGPLMRKLHREWKASGLPFNQYARQVGLACSTLRARMQRNGLETRTESEIRRRKCREMAPWQRIQHVEATELRRRIIIAEMGEEALKLMR